MAVGLFVKIGNKVFPRPLTGRSYKDDLLVNGGGSLKAPAGTQNALHTNSAAVSASSLSNTVPGIAGSLGGRWQFTVPAAANTDYTLFSYQVPAGYRLSVSAIAISSMVVTVLGAGATLLDWFLAVGDAASLADASQRRLPLGMQGFLTTAPVGTVAQDFQRLFDAPIIVPSAKFFTIGLTVPAVAASGAIRGTATVNGLFEAE